MKNKKEYKKEYYEKNKEKILKSNKAYYEKNKEKIAEQIKQYRVKNRAEVLERKKKYYENNKDKIKQYYEDNKKEISRKKNIYNKKRKSEDPSFKLKYNVGGIIRNMIIRNGGNKSRNSTSKYLDFTFQELKQHLENQFESWMNWNNYGKYNPETWDDNKSETWTWQIDHIIPHSDLPYDAMDHPNFKKCWALSNLRPYSAKQNLLDGANRIRHKRNKK